MNCFICGGTVTEYVGDIHWIYCPTCDFAGPADKKKRFSSKLHVLPPAGEIGSPQLVDFCRFLSKHFRLNISDLNVGSQLARHFCVYRKQFAVSVFDLPNRVPSLYVLGRTPRLVGATKTKGFGLLFGNDFLKERSDLCYILCFPDAVRLLARAYRFGEDEIARSIISGHFPNFYCLPGVSKDRSSLSTLLSRPVDYIVLVNATGRDFSELQEYKQFISLFAQEGYVYFDEDLLNTITAEEFLKTVCRKNRRLNDLTGTRQQISRTDRTIVLSPNKVLKLINGNWVYKDRIEVGFEIARIEFDIDRNTWMIELIYNSELYRLSFAAVTPNEVHRNFITAFAAQTASYPLLNLSSRDFMAFLQAHGIKVCHHSETLL